MIIALVGVLAVFPGSYAEVKQSQFPLFLACNMSVGYSIIACVRIIVSLILANVIRINKAKKGEKEGCYKKGGCLYIAADLCYMNVLTISWFV